MVVEIDAGRRDYGLVIDGQTLPAATGETFETVSPTTNLAVGTIAKAGTEDVDRAVAAARAAATARSTSVASALATRPTGRFVVGLTVSKVAPAAAGRVCPPITRP